VYQKFQGGDELKSRILFIGLRQARVSDIISSIEKVSDIRIAATTIPNPSGSSTQQLDTYDAVFVSRDLKQNRLVGMMEAIRDAHPDIPVVLIYAKNPDGRAFLLSSQYNCMLFSELDRLGRTLTSSELAESLHKSSQQNDLTRKLMDLTMCCGPCSTGE
jgi:hypothetical protein